METSFTGYAINNGEFIKVFADNDIPIGLSLGGTVAIFYDHKITWHCNLFFLKK